MKVKTKELTGYKHIFYHTGGGCGVGECGGGYACDDEYECIICGKKIRLLSKPEGHFEMPTIFYGRHHCDPKFDKKIEIKESSPKGSPKKE